MNGNIPSNGHKIFLAKKKEKKNDENILGSNLGEKIIGCQFHILRLNTSSSKEIDQMRLNKNCKQ